jgi:hypothetical protein
VLAGDTLGTVQEALWTLDLGAESAVSTTAIYAACLSYFVLEEDERAEGLARELLVRADFLPPVARALVGLGSRASVTYRQAVAEVVVSFETRDRYLERIPVADTVLMLQSLAAPRGLAIELESSTLPKA